jgi:hypothetical protein
VILSFRLQHHIFATNFYSYLIYGLGHHVYGSLFGVRLTKIASMALLPGSISICAIALSPAHSKPSSRRSRLFCSPASGRLLACYRNGAGIGAIIAYFFGSKAGGRKLLSAAGSTRRACFASRWVLATLASLLLATTNGGIWTQLAVTIAGVAMLLLLARFQEPWGFHA